MSPQVIEATTVATLCPKCGGSHDGSKGPGRRTWAYNEAVRARVAAGNAPTWGVAGQLPTYLEWSHYKRKESQRNTRCRGNLDAYVRYLETQSSKVLPGGKKSEAPYLSSVTYGDGRSADANAQAIYTVWFDVDEAGTWFQLRDWARAAGVTAIFQASYSRKGWHVGFPLAQAVRFAQGAEIERDRYKHEYKHVAAVLSALAGFEGVGGHCGMDLCVDRLVQPMFLPMLRSERDQVAQIELVEGGGLDWAGLLRQTGFDYGASVEAEAKTRGSKRAVRRGGERKTFTGSTDDFGPLGKALQAANYIGDQKDSKGFHAKCTHPELHSSDQAWNYAIYFPSTDMLWCSSSGCKLSQNYKDRSCQVARLPKIVQTVYWGEIESHHTLLSHERRDSDVPAISAWLDLVTKSEAVDRVKVTQAVIGALLTYNLSEKVALKVAAEAMPSLAAKDWVGRAVARFRRKKNLLGAGFLRNLLGLTAMRNLAFAISLDTGVPAIGLSKKLIGLELSRGENADFRESVAEALPSHEGTLGRFIARPVSCRRYHDDIVGDGEVVGQRTLVCENLGCVRCMHMRAMSEVEILSESWADKGRFFVHQLVLPDDDAFDEAEKVLRRRLHFPRAKILGRHVDGRPTLTWITNCSKSNSNLAASLNMLARKILPGAEVTHYKHDDLRPVLMAVYTARVSLLTHHDSFVRGRDREGLVGWAKFLRPMRGAGVRGSRHMVTSSGKSLIWPSREKVRDHNKKGNEEGKIDLSEFFSVEYVLKHTDLDHVLHRQKFPHQIDSARALARINTSLIRQQEAVDREPAYADLMRTEEAYERAVLARISRPPD